jgi:hypothetical protein
MAMGPNMRGLFKNSYIILLECSFMERRIALRTRCNKDYFPVSSLFLSLSLSLSLCNLYICERRRDKKPPPEAPSRILTSPIVRWQLRRMTEKKSPTPPPHPLPLNVLLLPLLFFLFLFTSPFFSVGIGGYVFINFSTYR